MLRALLTRLGLTRGAPQQLELALGSEGRPERRPERRSAAPPATRLAGPPPAPLAAPRAAAPPPPAPPHATDAQQLLQRLQEFGMQGITAVRFTRNRSTVVSFRGSTLRLHAAFAAAPVEVHRAIAVFVSGRGAARQAARRLIVAFPLPSDAVARPARRTVLHPDDRAMAERLQREHARLNALHFDGTLQPIRVTVSRRMSRRLGHYAPQRSHPGGAEIAISRGHVRRHGWAEAIDTLLHEMVHQWQEESGHPIDHGPIFRRKAREVGTTPRARRVLR